MTQLDSILPSAVRLPSKVQAVRQSLTLLARRVGAGNRLPTVQQLCQSLNVSNATLDRAMGELEEHGILIRHRGRGIYAGAAVGQTTIGVVCELNPFRVSASPFYPLMLDELRQRCSRSDRALRLYVTSAPQEDKALGEYAGAMGRRLDEDVLAGQIQGVVFLVRRDDEQLGRMTSQGVPWVAASNELPYPWCVRSDTRRLIELAVAALAARGCRRIGLMGHFERDPAGVSLMARTLDFFKAGLTAADLPFDPEICDLIERDTEECWRPNGLSADELGYHGTIELMRRADRPDGLVILDDMMTRGSLAALTRANQRPGKDLFIATHANRGSTSLLGYEDRLIRLEYDPGRFAELLLEMLSARMNGQPAATDGAIIQPRLILPEDARDADHDG